MCPFCHAEYSSPQDAATPATATRSSTRVPGSARKGISPAVKWGMPVLIVAFGVWYFIITGERRFPVGVVVPDIVAAPMGKDRAEALLRQMKQTATVETRDGGIAVTFPKASWPDHRDGQLALAQLYAQADGIMEGKRRAIAFYDPMGTLYAKGDTVGVMLVH